MKKHKHHYVSSWQGWVCSKCGKPEKGKLLKPGKTISIDNDVIRYIDI